MSMKVTSPPTLASLPGSKKWKELALAAIEVNNRCEVGGPKPTPRFTAAMAKTPSGGKAYQEDDRVGAFAPLG